jgi:hypothetical protein
LNHLEDFVYIGFPCADFGNIWSNLRSLQRILLVGIQVNQSFIEVIGYLPHLVQLRLIDACWGEEIDEYGLMLEIPNGLQKVVLYFGSSEELRQFLDSVSQPEETLTSSFREGLDVQYLEWQATLGSLRAKVADGSFWEMDTKNMMQHAVMKIKTSSFDGSLVYLVGSADFVPLEPPGLQCPCSP